MSNANMQSLTLLLRGKVNFCCRFLKILELIVQEPGAAFKAFLPNIISICMDHIYPIIAQVRSDILTPCCF